MEKRTSTMSRGELVGYGFGDLAGQLLINFVSMFFLIYCTDILMISAEAAGRIFLFTRISDAVTDLIMGRAADRTRTRFGCYRPWILAGIPVASISIVMMFSRAALRKEEAIIWMASWYFIYSLGTTMTGVPYGALPNVTTMDRRERTLMGVIRDYGANLAGFLISTFGTILALTFSENEQAPDAGGYRATVLLVAGFAVIGYLVVFFTQKERYRMPRNDADAKAALHAFFKNKPAMCLIGIALVFSFCLNFRTACTSYFCIYYLKKTEAISVLLSVVFTMPLFLLPLVPKMIQWVGKRNMLMVSGVLPVFSGILVFVSEKNMVWLVVSSILLGIALSCVFALVWASIPEAAEFGEIETGVCCPGVIYAIATFAIKCGSGFSVYFASLVMDSIGYNYALEVQSVATERGFAFWYGILPVVAGILMVFISGRYHLDESTVLKNTEKIRKKRLTVVDGYVQAGKEGE
ncbi:glycoside-pentoside-hexuronide (GPH):cation symporter [Cuneatibacter sp. NSJ-177]|uniref:MFS transporter n=1 Tax=Cuneatibacter sp. NSJ-177 TaxID=2931401 RepID=UPI001FCFBDA5|nr:glycoside-pentoside-hexuronide (GPH):cation symporter [Cuneatibacter sp. NSJ-177]MCJ7835539.1 glycoside-pentoside-hexuronide (GPH):cation symporter [Cuneatibacter sp. NSJ-177]